MRKEQAIKIHLPNVEIKDYLKIDGKKLFWSTTKK